MYPRSLPGGGFTMGIYGEIMMETLSYVAHYALVIVARLTDLFGCWLFYLGLKFMKPLFLSILDVFTGDTYREGFQYNFRESFCYQIAFGAKHKFCAILAVLLVPVVIVITQSYILHALNINIMEFGMGNPCYYYATVEYNDNKMIGTARIKTETYEDVSEYSDGNPIYTSSSYVYLSSLEVNGRTITFVNDEIEDKIGFNNYKKLEATNGKTYKCFITVFQDTSKTSSVSKEMDVFSLVCSILYMFFVFIGGVSYVISAIFARHQTTIQERERTITFSPAKRHAIKLAIPGTLIIGSVFSWVGDGSPALITNACVLALPVLIILVLHSRIEDPTPDFYKSSQESIDSLDTKNTVTSDKQVNKIVIKQMRKQRKAELKKEKNAAKKSKHHWYDNISLPHPFKYRRKQMHFKTCYLIAGIVGVIFSLLCIASSLFFLEDIVLFLIIISAGLFLFLLSIVGLIASRNT